MDDVSIYPYDTRLRRCLERLDRDKLVTLVTGWLSSRHKSKALRGSSSSQSKQDLIDAYKQQQVKKDVIMSIVERDWPTGLSLVQIAELDATLFEAEKLGIKWLVSKFESPSVTHDNRDPIRHSAFVSSLKEDLSSRLSTLAKVHVHVHRCKLFPGNLIRVQLYKDGPNPVFEYSSFKTFFCVLPQSSAYAYHSVGRDMVSKTVLQALALINSRYQKQRNIVSVNLSGRSVLSLYHATGPTSTANSLGAWSRYAKDQVDVKPLKPNDKIDKPQIHAAQDPVEKRRNLANLRFGFDPEKDQELLKQTALDEIDVQLTDPIGDHNPLVMMKLEGPHVFAGLHGLVVEDKIDGYRMPGWMTGQEGRSSFKSYKPSS